MTPLLLSALALILLYGVYVAAWVARARPSPAGFLDAGHAVPGWAVMFLLAGLAIAGLGPERHLVLVAQYGLQASHVAMGIVITAAAALLLWSRLWRVTRLAGLASPGEALGQVYGSVTLRVVVLGLAVLFALPFAADLLSFAALLIEGATEGAIPREAAVWLLAIPMAVAAVVGGWRAVTLALAMQSVLLVALLATMPLLAEILLDGPGFPLAPITVIDGVLWDRIPAVIQYTAGLGKTVPPFGIFSATGVFSAALALMGIVLAPAALYLGQTSAPGRGLGISAVWLTGGIAAGLMLLVAPLLGVRLDAGVVALAGALHSFEPLAGVALLVAFLLGALMAVNFFVTGGALLVTREFVLAYLLPQLDPVAQRFAARVAVALGFALMAFMASFMPLISAVLASVTLPLSVQLLPALAGLAFLRWISRGAVLAGLTIGMLVVIFTEPLGLIVFEALFVELPWGRWPLTVQSAAWGLGLNIAIVLLASAATLNAPDRSTRDRLHDALRSAPGGDLRSHGSVHALAALWAFLACGPGALLGNTFFSDPIFTRLQATLGIPSLWVWQILFWLLGCVLLWWLAYPLGFGRLTEQGIKSIDMAAPRRTHPPDWLTAGLARVVGHRDRA